MAAQQGIVEFTNVDRVIPTEDAPQVISKIVAVLKMRLPEVDPIILGFYVVGAIANRIPDVDDDNVFFVTTKAELEALRALVRFPDSRLRTLAQLVLDCGCRHVVGRAEVSGSRVMPAVLAGLRCACFPDSVAGSESRRLTDAMPPEADEAAAASKQGCAGLTLGAMGTAANAPETRRATMAAQVDNEDDVEAQQLARASIYLQALPAVMASLEPGTGNSSNDSSMQQEDDDDEETTTPTQLRLVVPPALLAAKSRAACAMAVAAIPSIARSITAAARAQGPPGGPEPPPGSAEWEAAMRGMYDDGLLEARVAMRVVRAVSLIDMGRSELVKNGAVPLLAMLMRAPDVDVRSNALRATFNLSVLNVQVRESIVAAGALPLLIGEAVVVSAGQGAAVGTLANLATEGDIKRAIVEEHGGLPPLLKLLRSNDNTILTHACRALFAIAANDENKLAITRAGGLPLLLQCMSSVCDPVRMNAAGALANLAIHPQNKLELVQQGALGPLRSLARSSNVKIQRQVARCLFALAAHIENRRAIIKERCLPALVDLLRSDSADVQVNAAGAVGNIAMTDEFKHPVVRAGALERLVQLAGVQDWRVQRQAARAIFTLTAKAFSKKRLAECGGLQPLIQLAGSDIEDIQRDAAGALANMAIGSDNKVSIVEQGGLVPLVKLLSSTVVAVQRQSARAIFALAGNADNQRAILEAGGLPPLVAQLRSPNEEVQKHASGALANLANRHPDAVVAHGALQLLTGIVLDHHSLEVRRQAARAVFNLTPSSCRRGQMVLTPYAGVVGEAQRARHEMRALFDAVLRRQPGKDKLRERVPAVVFHVPDDVKVKREQQAQQHVAQTHLQQQQQQPASSATAAAKAPHSTRATSTLPLPAPGIATTSMVYSNGEDDSCAQNPDDALEVMSEAGGIALEAEPDAKRMRGAASAQAVPAQPQQQQQQVGKSMAEALAPFSRYRAQQLRREPKAATTRKAALEFDVSVLFPLSDVGDTVDSFDFRGHLAILMPRCAALADLVKETLRAGARQEGELLTIAVSCAGARRRDVWLALLEFLYTDSVRKHAQLLRTDEDAALSLCDVALALGLPRLRCFCAELQPQIKDARPALADLTPVDRESLWAKDMSALLEDGGRVTTVAMATAADALGLDGETAGEQDARHEARRKTKIKVKLEPGAEAWPAAMSSWHGLPDLSDVDLLPEPEDVDAAQQQQAEAVSAAKTRRSKRARVVKLEPQAPLPPQLQQQQQQTRFRAHKVLLWSRCGFYKAKFGAPLRFSDATAWTSEWPGSEATLRVALRYMYCGLDETLTDALGQDPSLALETLVAANAFGLDGLQLACENALARTHLRPDAVVHVLAALRLVHAPVLRACCMLVLLQQCLATGSQDEAVAAAADPSFFTSGPLGPSAAEDAAPNALAWLRLPAQGVLEGDPTFTAEIVAEVRQTGVKWGFIKPPQQQQQQQQLRAAAVVQLPSSATASLAGLLAPPLHAVTDDTAAAATGTGAPPGGDAGSADAAAAVASFDFDAVAAAQANFMGGADDEGDAAMRDNN